MACNSATHTTYSHCPCWPADDSDHQDTQYTHHERQGCKALKACQTLQFYQDCALRQFSERFNALKKHHESTSMGHVSKHSYLAEKAAFDLRLQMPQRTWKAIPSSMFCKESRIPGGVENQRLELLEERGAELSIGHGRH